MKNKKIKVGLLGLGKTGKTVADILLKDKQTDLVFVVKNILAKPTDFPFTVGTKEMLPELIQKFEPHVIVDFTSPEATLQNIKHLKKDSGIVIATTGFSSSQFRRLKAFGKKLKVLYAPNISSGINVLMRACKVIDEVWKGLDVVILEQHFKGKKDAPSGTAKKIANMFKGAIPTLAIRAGGIVGVHEVMFVKENQKITLRHESFSRQVFAQGAKDALVWLNKQKTGFYEMRDMYGY
jgi:4-hydroxy-tetrahydrodipicolinate reductase